MQDAEGTASVVEITVVTSAYGQGQKITSIAVQYSAPVVRDSLDASMYEVEGYAISNLCVSDTVRGEPVWTGCFVQLMLDGDEDAVRLCKHVGRGPGSRLAIDRPVLHLSQRQDIPTTDGRIIPAFAQQPSTHVDLGIADKFLTTSFTTKEGHQLGYNLYIPEHMISGQKYPVVLFMHDAGSCSDDPQAPLLQGTGATVWAIESYYSRRPCFVLAPHYPQMCANDDFEVGWEAEATIELLEHLCGIYAIDRKRIYGTGQSMGCMMLCELVLGHPRYFAGCLLVAGQWDPVRMTAAHAENLWIVVSSGDTKAFPIMRAAMGEMEKAGGRLCYSHVDAQADAAWLDAAIRSQKQKNANLNLTWFQGHSVIPAYTEVSPGAHHVNTWVKAYDIKALREWLFEQRLP